MSRRTKLESGELDLSQFLGGESANKRRGSNHVTMARAFVDRYPPGAYLTDEQFDEIIGEWVPDYDPKDRGTWAGRLRSAGSNGPLMRASNHPAFRIRSDRKGGWNVTGCDVALRDKQVLSELKQFTDTKLRDLLHVAEGVDLSSLPRILADYLKLCLDVQFGVLQGSLISASRAAKEMDKIMGAIEETKKMLELSAPDD